jgi:hypothetical protein
LGEDVEDAFVYGLKEGVDDERDSDPKNWKKIIPLAASAPSPAVQEHSSSRIDDNLKVKKYAIQAEGNLPRNY